MMRADALNSHIYPVIMEMNGTKQILILHAYSKDERKLKEFLDDKQLSHISSTDNNKSKGIIVKECSTEEDES